MPQGGYRMKRVDGETKSTRALQSCICHQWFEAPVYTFTCLSFDFKYFVNIN